MRNLRRVRRAPPPVATGLHAQPQQGGKEETEEPFAAAGGTTLAAAGPDGSVGRRSYLPAERHAVHLTPMSGLHGVALADAPSWSDEFETCSATTGMLDPSVWTYERGFKRNPGDEVQYYREESVRCHNGKLVITASEHSDGKWYTESEAARCSSEVPEEHRPRYCAKLGEKIFFTRAHTDGPAGDGRTPVGAVRRAHTRAVRGQHLARLVDRGKLDG